MDTFQTYYHKHNHNSYLQQLSPDAETEENYPNKETRSVRSGHYVLSEATPIPDPLMITYSHDLMKELGLSEHIMESDQMLKYLTGHSEITNDLTEQSETIDQWVTPYALSIYGQPMISNYPFKNNTGYGDGRAHSIGEFVVNGQRYEFQLKGSGTTPFSRFGDGRAVLRSSIREYLVSEAMHNLRVPTTRALSLIVSESERVERSWYQNDENTTKKQQQEPSKKCQISDKPPTCSRKGCDSYDEIIEHNPVAIVCRVSESFIRVGHLELFGFRAASGNQNHDLRILELEQLFKHMVFREYQDLYDLSIEMSIPEVCDRFAIKLSSMISDWIRCGYIQSNFNSDNCLVSGRTLDYGPFGFMEKYDPDKNFWTGGGQHFSFMNQVNAGKKNYEAFVNSLKPLLKNRCALDQCIRKFDKISEDLMNRMWGRKLGLIALDWKQHVEPFFKRLLDLMSFSDFDYTIFWRQLAEFPLILDDKQKLFHCIEKAFYIKTGTLSDDWKLILSQYIELLKKEHMLGKRSLFTISQMMKRESPKYIPREWMLVKAYTDANNGSFRFLLELQELFKKPYDEQPEMEKKYYKLTPLELVEDKPGYSQMSCSS